MNKVRRVVALLSVIVIVGLIIAAFICGITGSKYFFGLLFLSFAVPIVLWVFMWFTHLINGDSNVISKEEMDLLNDIRDKKKESNEEA